MLMGDLVEILKGDVLGKRVELLFMGGELKLDALVLLIALLQLPRGILHLSLLCFGGVFA